MLAVAFKSSLDLRSASNMKSMSFPGKEKKQANIYLVALAFISELMNGKVAKTGDDACCVTGKHWQEVDFQL